MKSGYKRANLIITEFYREDVIATSGDLTPTEPTESKLYEKENAYGSFTSFDLKGPGGSWF